MYILCVSVRHCIKNINDERVFIVLYAVSAVYFAGVMVRLMLTLTPCVCVLAGKTKLRMGKLLLWDEFGESYFLTTLAKN